MDSGGYHGGSGIECDLAYFHGKHTVGVSLEKEKRESGEEDMALVYVKWHGGRREAVDRVQLDTCGTCV